MVDILVVFFGIQCRYDDLICFIIIRVVCSLFDINLFIYYYYKNVIFKILMIIIINNEYLSNIIIIIFSILLFYINAVKVLMKLNVW